MHFIFEGLNGTGKSTIVQKAYEYLCSLGYDVIVAREPGQTLAGTKLRSMLLSDEYDLNVDTQIFLMLADRSENMKKVVLPALKSGKIVLQDRSYVSSMIFQSSSSNFSTSEIAELSKKLFEHTPIWVHVETNLETIAQRIYQRENLDSFEIQQMKNMEKILMNYRQYIKELNGYTIENNGTLEESVVSFQNILNENIE